MQAKISLRVSQLTWTRPEGNTELLDLLRRHPVVEEVAFFTQTTHAVLPLEEIEKRAAILAEVIPQYRAQGIRAGINHLSTLGHLEENIAYSLQGNYQHLIGHDGRESGACVCASDPNVRDYIRHSYLALANADPDFLWIDDDVRVEGHNPVTFACFCPFCLEKRSQETGHEWTRESMVASFSEGSREAKLANRRAWLEHNRGYVSDVLSLIRDTVDEVKPGLTLGYMTSPLNVSGAAFERWARDLGGESGLEARPAKWRPGGGFYTENFLPGLISKAHLIGPQVAPVPSAITDIQYELENFPYQRLSKSATIVLAEICAAIGTGCTGVAMNVVGTVQDALGEFEIYFDRVQETAPFFNRAVETFGRSACEGLGGVNSPDVFATLRPDGGWFNGSSWIGDAVPADWSEIGLPFGYGGAPASATMLRGDSVLALSPDEIKTLLAGGVALDVVSLGHLNEMGFGHLTGFEMERELVADCLERAAHHPLNGAYGGWQRDCRPAFINQVSYIFKPTQEGTETLDEMVDFDRQILGIATGLFENELGGRVAVLGYYPWSTVQSLAKTEQLKALTRWLSRDTLPAYVQSYSRVALWCRRNEAGQPVFLVQSLSLDLQDVTIAVLNAPASFQCVRMDGSETTLTRAEGSPYASFTIPKLGAWQAAILV